MVVGQPVELVEGEGRGSVQVGKQVFEVALPPHCLCNLLQSLFVYLFLLAREEVEKFFCVCQVFLLADSVVDVLKSLAVDALLGIPRQNFEFIDFPFFSSEASQQLKTEDALSLIDNRTFMHSKSFLHFAVDSRKTIFQRFILFISFHQILFGGSMFLDIFICFHNCFVFVRRRVFMGLGGSAVDGCFVEE